MEEGEVEEKHKKLRRKEGRKGMGLESGTNPGMLEGATTVTQAQEDFFLSVTSFEIRQDLFFFLGGGGEQESLIRGIIEIDVIHQGFS